MTLPATIYARFSTRERAKGHSLQRQLELGRELCARKGWLCAPEREIRDEGRSAFHGANRAEGGALYEFERQAEQGLFRNGHVFIVEHLDRITRKGWEDAYEFVKRLTSNGVTVVTVDGGRIFPPDERVPMSLIMEVIVKSELAWEESEKKSRRTSAAWKAKLDRAAAGDKRAMTALTPAWIDVDPSTREHRLIPNRVAVLNEMYELSAAGMGTPRITRLLNGRGEPTWGHKKSRADSWHTSYVTKLLRNRAVLGELQPMRRSRAAGSAPEAKEVRLLDYYPRVIDTALFERVQAERAGRRQIGGRRGTMANLFSGFVYCASCGGRMAYSSSRKAGTTITAKNGSGKLITYVTGVDHSFLQCDNARRRVTGDGQLRCTNLTRVRYERLEPVILDRILSDALSHTNFSMPDGVSALSAEVAELERQVDGKRARLANLIDSFARTGSAAMEQASIALELEVAGDAAALAAAQTELAKARGGLSAEELGQRVRDIRTVMEGADEEERTLARQRVNQALRRVVDFLRCSPDKSVLVVWGNGSQALHLDEQGKAVNGIDLSKRLDLHRGLTTEPGSRTYGALQAVQRRRAEAG